MSQRDSGDNDKVQLKNLPGIEDLKSVTKTRIVLLLARLDRVIAERDALNVEEDDIKTELETIQKATGRAGFRHGTLCFMAQAVAGRRTLDKMLLLENGCPVAALNASYKVGAESVRRTFKNLEETNES